MHVADLFFTPEVIAHLARHDVSERNVRRVLAGSPRFFNNLPGRAATHVMIGPDDRERILFIALIETGHDDVWEPITGWESRAARAIYAELEAKDEPS